MDLEDRIARLEARAELGELASRYAIACDEHDMPALEALFTEDAVFDAPSGLMRAEGRGAIMEMFGEVLSIRGPGYHWTHDCMVRFDRGEGEASGLVLSHAETTPNGVQSLAAMKYDDLYRREEGGWRFSRRTISFLYYVPVAEYDGALARSDRLMAGDALRQADYPEALPQWRAFAARRQTNGGQT